MTQLSNTNTLYLKTCLCTLNENAKLNQSFDNKLSLKFWNFQLNVNKQRCSFGGQFQISPMSNGTPSEKFWLTPSFFFSVVVKSPTDFSFRFPTTDALTRFQFALSPAVLFNLCRQFRHKGFFAKVGPLDLPHRTGKCKAAAFRDTEVVNAEKHHLALMIIWCLWWLLY